MLLMEMYCVTNMIREPDTV